MTSNEKIGKIYGFLDAGDSLDDLNQAKGNLNLIERQDLSTPNLQNVRLDQSLLSENGLISDVSKANCSLTLGAISKNKTLEYEIQTNSQMLGGTTR